MSYCRWSSDDFKSDLYVYESVYDCWTIHVAGNRIVGEVPTIRRVEPPIDEAKVAQWRADSAAQRVFLDAAERQSIDIPGAGKTFNLASPGDCADKVVELVALGFYVPDGVISALREEQQELDGIPSNASTSAPSKDDPTSTLNPLPQGGERP